MKIAKFGGTSLASAKQIRKVIEIVKADSDRRCVVVSAPGKRWAEDGKITELLYSWVRHKTNPEKWICETKIIDRYQGIIDDFKIKINFKKWFSDPADIFERLPVEHIEGYIASRGEYWMAKIMADILGYRFIDATSFIAFDKNGALDMPETERRAKNIGLDTTARTKGIVVPGFYGQGPRGEVKTFSRGGSDITGAIVAACVDADLYENWTDVDGVFMADPRIVDNPKKINELTYGELRELAYMGANVLHDESVFPVRKLAVPINVRNTDNPKDSGTMIVAKIKNQERIPGSIIGISGKNGFSVIKIEKTLMDYEVGFLRRICQVMEKNHINIQNIPGGIDTLSIIVKSSELDVVKESVLKEITAECSPDTITVESNMALVCVVGSAMANTPGVSAKIFGSIAEAGINIRMINQGSSEISIIIGVDEKDYKKTIRAIYEEFIN